MKDNENTFCREHQMREAVRYDQDYAETDAGFGLKTAAGDKDVAGRAKSGAVKLVYAAGDQSFDGNDGRPDEWHPLAGPAPTD